jgi:hypothetical protein
MTCRRELHAAFPRCVTGSCLESARNAADLLAKRRVYLTNGASGGGRLGQSGARGQQIGRVSLTRCRTTIRYRRQQPGRRTAKTQAARVRIWSCSQFTQRATDRESFPGWVSAIRAGHWRAVLSELAKILREPSRDPGR